MHREVPVAGGDRGWRCFAGDEDDAYMAKVANHGSCDLNTVAKYDPAIIPFLTAAPGSRFDKVQGDIYVPLEQRRRRPKHTYTITTRLRLGIGFFVVAAIVTGGLWHSYDVGSNPPVMQARPMHPNEFT